LHTYIFFSLFITSCFYHKQFFVSHSRKVECNECAWLHADKSM
jgi:hypothetical protein